MMVKAFIYFAAMLASSAIVMAGAVTDPEDDASASSVNPSPDLRFGSVTVIGTNLHVKVRLAEGTYHSTPEVGSTRVTLSLDTDEDPDTGHPGVTSGGTIDNGVIGSEYILTIGPTTASLFEFTGPPINTFSFRKSIAVVVNPNGPDVVVLLADLGDDDGAINYKLTSFAQVSESGFTGILDVMPDAGLSPGTSLSDGTITDPEDDASTSPISPSPDLRFASAQIVGTNLQVSVRFTAGTYNSVSGVGSSVATVSLDSDQDPDTGHPGVAADGTIDGGVLGVEYIVRIGAEEALLFEYTGPPINTFSLRKSIAVTINDDGPDVLIALGDLGDDDGALHFKVTSGAQLSESGFTGILDIMSDEALPPGAVGPADLPCPVPPLQVDPSASSLDIAIKWGCLVGSPACDDPGLVGELTVRDMLLSRQERASQCIWLPQCNIALRSAAQNEADLDGQFAQLPDPETTLGQPGDVVLCLPQQECPGQSDQTPQPDVLAVWDSAAAAWADVNKGILAVSVNRIITPSGILIARGLVVPNLNGGIGQPWLLLADPTVMNEPNERTLAKMIGEILTLTEVTDVDNLMRPLTLEVEPGVSLTTAQCQQARDYLSSPEGMVLDPPVRGPANVPSFSDQVYDGLEKQVPVDEKYLDVINSVVVDSGAAKEQVVFCSVLGGLIASQGPQGQQTPICVSFALDCDNNQATGDNAGLVVPGLDFAGAEFVAELLVDRKTMDVVPVLKASTGLGSFISVQFEPGAFVGDSSNGVIRVIDPSPNYDGPQVIPFTTQMRATLSSKFFTTALAAMGVVADESGRTFPVGLRFQVATSQGAGQPAVDINPPENVLLEFEQTPFPQLFVTPRVAPGQTVAVQVTGMPPKVPLKAVVGTIQVDLPAVVTDGLGAADFDLIIPQNTSLGQVQMTIEVDDTTTAVTANGVIRVVLCPADFDESGDLTIFDFLEFQNDWEAGLVFGDFDGDGLLTIFDFLAYQNAFEEGCQ